MDMPDQGGKKNLTKQSGSNRTRKEIEYYMLLCKEKYNIDWKYNLKSCECYREICALFKYTSNKRWNFGC